MLQLLYSCKEMINCMYFFEITHRYFSKVLPEKSALIVKSLLFLSVAPQSKSHGISQAASPPSPSLSRHADTSRSLLSPRGSLHRGQSHTSLDCSSSDADGSCYTELYPGPQSYVERLQVEDGPVGNDPLRVEDDSAYFPPVVETASLFKPSRYQSPLMPKENKPLEVGILWRVKELLAEVDPRTAAKHITKADCMVQVFKLAAAKVISSSLQLR